MKDVKTTLLDRRSIRRYEYDPIDPADMDFIVEAIRNTPTSYNGQQFSVIEISDQDLKEQIYQLTGQKQIKTCNRFLLFLADYHKISLLAEKKGIKMSPFYDTVDGLTVGIVDASLAMMSAIVAANSRGIGACPIGYARTVDPKKLSEMMGLPPHVFIVCGLALGIPREMPDLKPKQPAETVVMHNRYADDAQLLPHLTAYDETITSYNATRAGGKTTTNDWCDHIIDYYREAENYKMLDALRSRGFDVKK
jgi:nitroreductase